jgi:pyruvate,water dikinase
MINKRIPYIINLRNLKPKDVELVGKTAIDRSVLYRENLPVLPSFVITSVAFDDFLKRTGLVGPISKSLSKVKPFVYDTAKVAASDILGLMYKIEIPNTIALPIIEAYKNLSAYQDETFINIEPSHIISDKFVPQNSMKISADIKGEENIIKNIKNAWLSLFTAEAIEYRANNYYQGPLTIALVVKRVSAPEISGEFNLLNPSQASISASYGYFDPINADKYMVDLSKRKITSKELTRQKYLIVNKNRGSEIESENTKIEISEDWQERQKISDDRIFEVAKICIKICKNFDKPLNIKWFIESGDLLVESFKDIEPEILEDQISLDEKETEVKPQIELPIAPVDLKVDIKKNELREDNVVMKAPEKIYEKVFKLINPKSTSIAINDPAANWIGKYDFKIRTGIDISSMNSSRLFSLKFFDLAYFDATSMVVSNKILPEEIIKDQKKVTDLISSYAIDISTASRSIYPKNLLYSFSNITNYERDLLDVDPDKYEFSGDERFIDYPESMLIELYAIKRSLEIYPESKISLVLPAVRSINNINDLLKILRSKSELDSNKFHTLIELSIPYMIYEIDKISDDINGVVLDLETLMRLMIHREKLRQGDYDLAFEIIEYVSELTKKKNIEGYIKLHNFDEDLIKGIVELGNLNIVFSSVPFEQTMELIKKTENKGMLNLDLSKGVKETRN